MGREMNDAWFLAVNRFARATPWLHAVVAGWATYGVVVFALLLVGAWWVGRRSGPQAVAGVVCAAAATLIAVGVNQPIVAAVAEPRPYATHPDALVLVARTSDPAFPSDHATMAGAVAVGLLFASWRWPALRGWTVAAFIAAPLMALARIYIGAHYPGDVAAGLALGAVVAAAVWLVGYRLLARATTGVGRGPLGPLVQTQRHHADTAHP